MNKRLLKEVTDKTLMKWLYEAQEMRIGRDIKAIKDEMNKRSKEE